MYYESANPYFVMPGASPACFAGRSRTSTSYMAKLACVRSGDYAKGMLILGIKYIGKSTLLTKFKDIADSQGDSLTTHNFNCSWIESIAVEMEEFVNKKFDQPETLQAANSWLWWILDKTPHWAADVVVRLKDALPMAKVNFAKRYIEYGKRLKAANKSQVIFIDNFHEASIEDLKVMIAVFQITERENLPILFVAAAHPVLRTMLHQANPGQDNILENHLLDRLTAEEVRAALDLSAREYGREFTEEALDEMVRICNGYPYLVQLLGYQVWERSTTKEMTIKYVRDAMPDVKKEMVNGILESRYYFMTMEERRFSVAMASLPVTQRTLDNIIAKLGGVEADHEQTIRELFAQNIIYGYNENNLDFTVPMFDDYLLECERSTKRFH